MSMQGRLESFSRFKTIDAWQDLIQVAFHMHTVDSERGVVACCRGSMFSLTASKYCNNFESVIPRLKSPKFQVPDYPHLLSRYMGVLSKDIDLLGTLGLRKAERRRHLFSEDRCAWGFTTTARPKSRPHVCMHVCMFSYIYMYIHT